MSKIFVTRIVVILSISFVPLLGVGLDSSTDDSVIDTEHFQSDYTPLEFVDSLKEGQRIEIGELEVLGLESFDNHVAQEDFSITVSSSKPIQSLSKL